MLDKDSLEMLPKDSDSFLWTDFVELRALIHPDHCFSRGDLAAISTRWIDIHDLEDSNEDFVETNSIHTRRKKRGLDVRKRWREIANFAIMRQAEFLDFYPFRLSDDEDTLLYELDKISHAKYLYLGLLIASCMRHIPRNRQGEVAKLFEQTCFVIFSCLMPTGSEIRATWANGGPEATYKGTLYEKMQEIAKDIRCTANFEPRDFKENDRGDGGIDLIAWHPMADNRESIPIAFAQCGCSKDDWNFKQLEASYSKHSTNLPVRHPWATYYFLPLDLRWPDGDWAYKSDIGQAIIVDRLRLLRLASQYKIHDQLPVMPFIDEIRAFRYG